MDKYIDKLPGPVAETVYLLKGSAQEFSDDNAARLAAALAYYTVFSLAPLLLVIIALVGFFWEAEQDEVRDRLIGELSDAIGQDGAAAIQTMLEASTQAGGGIIATVVGVGGLIWGATRIFAQLQGALNDIWDVRPLPDRGIMNMISTRVTSFTMVLVMGFLLLVSFVLSAVLSAAGDVIAEHFAYSTLLLEVINHSIALIVITLLFAAIYKYLPDVEIKWRDVWVGAFITAVIFNLAKYGISVYLSTTGTATMYGAAGSFVVLLLWVYFSALIFFFGAEITQVYARRHGHKIRASAHAYRFHDISHERLVELEEAKAQVRTQPKVVTEFKPQKPAMWKRTVPVAAAFFIGRWLLKRKDPWEV